MAFNPLIKVMAYWAHIRLDNIADAQTVADPSTTDQMVKVTLIDGRHAVINLRQLQREATWPPVKPHIEWSTP
jgi:hypothetical protein